MIEAVSSLEQIAPCVNITERERSRFLRRFTKRGPDDCWLWTGKPGPEGYGHYWVGGKSERPHRVSFAIHNGRWPRNCCCHSCDVRLCVNPAHLWEGTDADNVRDKVQKRRHYYGSRQWQSKLTDESVSKMRLMAKTGAYSQNELAAIFGVGQSVISRTVRGIRWTHVPITP